MQRTLCLIVVGLLAPALASAADLTKLDRRIAKEPAYQTKAPAYCLAVFGPDAAYHAWIVRDGDVLYVDKNGNGDLTEASERIASDKGDGGAFFAGTLRIGGREHRNFVVRSSRLADYGDDVKSHPVAKAALAKNKDAELMSVSVEADAPALKARSEGGRVAFMARYDANGPLLFAPTPAAAPVIHFGGPLTVACESAKPSLYVNIVHDLMLLVGTPGVGAGTFAMLAYDKVIPREAVVVVEAEFPSKKSGDPPVRETFELKERC